MQLSADRPKGCHCDGGPRPVYSKYKKGMMLLYECGRDSEPTPDEDSYGGYDYPTFDGCGNVQW